MNKPKEDLTLSELCEKCGTVRNGVNVFKDCRCILRSIYSDHEKQAITGEFTEFKRITIRLETKPVLGDIKKFIDLMTRMNPNTRRLIKYPGKERLFPNIWTLLKPIRRASLIEFTANGGTDLQFYREIRNMTPQMARITEFPECIYKEGESIFCERICEDKLQMCHKHIMMFYILHTELQRVVPDELAKICLDYLLQDYELVLGNMLKVPT